jgi:arylsulfatase A-like enzyme
VNPPKPALLLVCLLPLACDGAPTVSPPAPPAAAKPALAEHAPAKRAPVAAKPRAERKATGPLNVLFLTVDALRYDVTSPSYPRKLTPNLSRLAEDSVVFENHRSTTSFTAQSVPVMLSGRYASSLYRSGFFFAGYAPANEFFTELLQQKKVRTLGLHSHLYFDRNKGLDQGFDVWEMVSGITFNERTDEHVTSPKTTSRLIELLSSPENTSGQFFAWTHYTDPHHGYVTHPEAPSFGNSERDRYESEVFYTDLWIGKLLDWAEKQSWWKQTAVVVSADHGEAFGEHGMNQHAHELWEELVRVPLIVRVPGIEPRRVAAPHTHVDLAPTFLELMGQEALAGFQGKSLVAELRGESAGSSRTIALELCPDNVQDGRRAIVRGKHKLIRWGSGAGYRQALFDLAADPGEKKDLSKADPELLAEMTRALDETFAKIPSVTPYGGMTLKGAGKANGPRKPELASL